MRESVGSGSSSLSASASTSRRTRLDLQSFRTSQSDHRRPAPRGGRGRRLDRSSRNSSRQTLSMEEAAMARKLSLSRPARPASGSTTLSGGAMSQCGE